MASYQTPPVTASNDPDPIATPARPVLRHNPCYRPARWPRRARADDARFADRCARESTEHFAAIIDDVRRLRTLLQEVLEKERALGGLEDALKPGAFLK